MSTARHDTNRALARAEPPDTIDGDVLQVAGANLSVDFASTTVAPTYSTLLTASLTALEASSFLDIVFYCAWCFTGPPPLTFRQASVRFSLNGTLIAPSRATSAHSVTAADGCLSFNRRLAISGGVQTVVAEAAMLAGAGGVATFRVDAASRPDTQGAHLFLKETR
jgi:hypothetical protein